PPTVRKNRSIFPRPCGRPGVEWTSLMPNFAQARSSHESTKALPLSTYTYSGTPPRGQRRAQRGSQPHSVFGEAPPVPDHGPGMVVDEREQVGLATLDS